MDTRHELENQLPQRLDFCGLMDIGLSSRMAEYVLLIRSGMTYKQIAERLGINKGRISESLAIARRKMPALNHVLRNRGRQFAAFKPMGDLIKAA